ncbi:hypothetical protein CK228_28470 [Mesorhizobium sp. WSM4312]|uniref:hypothetical protein n=1 Tax=unclassified Mesorhizobium TaxID=325217 RepID=UPI000BAF8C17|nr:MULTISPECIES: hypothetical protein [unclassified Mesorhizobium]PBB65214.1 hypothetical protein CK228_28470 [Mesorhizobium sp. WSM4312]PBC18666.1 hypothetical protein CK226_33675 [Mesorhizobium sp. WSM4311]TRC78043.1 hypothetical protein FJV81_10725 [Mesorhizobium sp. WSM4315]TRC79232.1 hypothetical protein FJV83_28480 [Mesorhizobium sp. WSM4307]TRC80186.1 hypothetical protein FJV80_22695 [Mesorhizobium sp. WSM4310]
MKTYLIASDVANGLKERGDVVVSAEEHEGHIAQHQIVRNGENFAAVQVDALAYPRACSSVPPVVPR